MRPKRSVLIVLEPLAHPTEADCNRSFGDRIREGRLKEFGIVFVKKFCNFPLSTFTAMPTHISVCVDVWMTEQNWRALPKLGFPASSSTKVSTN